MTAKLILTGASRGGTEIVETDSTGQDLLEGLPQPRTPAELKWWDVLNEPVIQYRLGQYERFSREDTHVRIGLLDDQLPRQQELLASLEHELAEATQVVEADAARLEAAHQTVKRLAYEAQVDTPLTVRNRDQASVLPTNGIAVDEVLMLPQRRRRLGQTQEWTDYKQLEQRCRSDARSPEYKAIRRKSDLTERCTYERQILGGITTKLYELRQNLEWHAEQDVRRDPNSAWSRARQELADRLETELHAGRISGYRLPDQ